MMTTETPKSTEDTVSAFRISSRTKRTPVNSPIVAVEAEEAVLINGKTPQSTAVAETLIAPAMHSPKQEYILQMRASEEEALVKCHKVLQKMREAINKQRNISRDVQTGVSELDELLDVIADYRRNWKAAEKERQANNLPRIEQMMCLPPQTPQASQYKRSAPSPVETNPEKRHKKKAVDTSKNVIPIRTQAEDDAKWKIVSKNRKKKAKNRPDAVIIKPSSGHSYSDVLKNIRQNVRPEETEVAIRSISKTKTGAILLVMAKGGQHEKFCEAIKVTLKEAATVEERKPKATIEIQDLDTLTTTEEVQLAVHDATKAAIADIGVHLTAPNYREQKRAFVTLPVMEANRILETKRLKVGMTSCIVKYREETKRCYRCFGTGHKQYECKGPDRKGMDLCIRCGEKGHKLKQCKNKPKCCICVEQKKNNLEHLPGSRSCPSSKQQ